MSFVEHLIELRDRLLRVVIAMVVVMLVAFPFANDLFEWLAAPVLASLPEGGTLLAIGPASPFITPFKMVLWLAVFVTVPVSLYQVWSFVAPGLYKHEQRLVMPLAITSTLLFYVGIAFAYFVVFPLVFPFLVGYASEGVTVAPDIAAYLDFVLTIFFAFGVAFEVPIATIIVCWAGITTPEQLVSKRPYIVVGAFVVGMFLTPPDMISQTLLAIPMWALFEIGVICARFYVREEEPDIYGGMTNGHNADYDDDDDDDDDD
ncbi:MAG: twin-arginine translocase subunit TatC, partial [Chromatiales bacterium]|nr:twin-arginine translocase subunit TatC [Chromatiales bacterium]